MTPLGKSDAPGAEPKWPQCHWCGRQVEAGLPCTAKRCPWQRDNGRVIAPITK